MAIGNPEQRAVRMLVACLMLISGIVLVCSLRWGLLHDAPIMHYLAWRITAGDVPYRDFFDMNLPGTYLVHLAVLKLLGPGDFAWRMFDLIWLSATIALIAAYCRPFGRLAATLSALAFASFHLTNGPWEMGQRDFLILPLLLGACYGLVWFQERKPRAIYLVLAGLAAGAATTIKPHAVLFVLLIGVTALVLARRKRYPFVRAVPAYVLAAAAPVGLVGVWLWKIGGLFPLLEIIFEYLLPVYAGLLGFADRNLLLLARWMALLLLLSPLLALSLWRIGVGDGVGFRHRLLALGFIYAIVHYVGQNKGWLYHLYPLACFCCPLAFAFADRIGREGRKAIRVLFLANLLLFTTGVGMLGRNRIRLHLWNPREARRVAWLTRELSPQLSAADTVQVMGTVGGGIHALYEWRCRQPTRFIYDFHFFAHDPNHRYIRGLRREFLNELKANPPKFIIVLERSFPGLGYERLKRFPAFCKWTSRRYYQAGEAHECRIYARKHD